MRIEVNPAADTDRRFRLILMAAAVFNGLGAAAFAWPAGPGGALMGLPPVVPIVDAALVSLFVLLFAGLYAWLSRQNPIPRPMVFFGALGKAAAFLTFLVCGFIGALPWRGVALGGGDLVFAVLFLAWLRRA